MGEPGRIRVWWSRLPRAWRFNVTLYVLACLALFGLIVQVLTDEAPQRVEVASESRRTPSTRVTDSTEPTTTLANVPATPPLLSPEAVPTTAPQSPTPPAAGFDPSTATTLPCRNSGDPACGPFFYDPAPRNAPLAIIVEIESSSPIPGGQEVRFRATVTDPDHRVGGCAAVDFGDGSGEQRPCSPEPSCGGMYGPWDPPPSRSGSATLTFSHAYQARPQQYSARFTFRTEADRCRDPYVSEGSATVSFIVPEGT